MGVKREELATYYAAKYPLTFARELVTPDAHLAARYQKAWDLARKAATLLKKQYGASKVVVFGSLVDEARFTRWSDVDLAVWGVPDQWFFAAVGAVTALSAELKVDLVDPASCRESLRKAIENEGITL